MAEGEYASKALSTENEVNIKPVPKCNFVDYNIAGVRLVLSQHLTTCSRLEDFA